MCIHFLAFSIASVGFFTTLSSTFAQTQENQMKLKQINILRLNQTTMNTEQKFVFHPLPYAFDALEPYIDKQTVEIHYSKHHKAYYDNFIAAIKGTEMETMDIKDIFKSISKISGASKKQWRWLLQPHILLAKHESQWRRYTYR